jgi:hypothetical protein
MAISLSRLGCLVADFNVTISQYYFKKNSVVVRFQHEAWLIISKLVTAPLTVHKSKTILGRTIKESRHSYLFTLVSVTNRFALNGLASNHSIELLPELKKNGIVPPPKFGERRRLASPSFSWHIHLTTLQNPDERYCRLHT